MLWPYVCYCFCMRSPVAHSVSEFMWGKWGVTPWLKPTVEYVQQKKKKEEEKERSYVLIDNHQYTRVKDIKEGQISRELWI